MTKIDQRVRSEICRRYEAGERADDLAREYGYSIANVYWMAAREREKTGQPRRRVRGRHPKREVVYVYAPGCRSIKPEPANPAPTYAPLSRSRVTSLMAQGVPLTSIAALHRVPYRAVIAILDDVKG